MSDDKELKDEGAIEASDIYFGEALGQLKKAQEPLRLAFMLAGIGSKLTDDVPLGFAIVAQENKQLIESIFALCVNAMTPKGPLN